MMKMGSVIFPTRQSFKNLGEIVDSYLMILIVQLICLYIYLPHVALGWVCTVQILNSTSRNCR